MSEADRYAGRGEPVDHWRLENATQRLDVLAFADGSFAVWHPGAGKCLSFFPTKDDAMAEAEIMLGIWSGDSHDL